MYNTSAWAHRLTCLITAAIIAALSWSAHGQHSPEQSQSADKQQQQQQQQQQQVRSLPWPIQLGLRSHQISQAFPLIDRVVLVPDAATYIDELAKWSPQGRWPVLIEDDRLTPMFVRRFKPAQLIRRESIGSLPADRAERERLLEAVVIQAFGGDPETKSVRELFEKHRYAPPGVVITSVDDPAWTAALALAAGRGQLLAFVDGEFGSPNDQISSALALRLMEAVDAAVEQQGYPFRQLGDVIDTITVCRAMGLKSDVLLRPEAQAKIGGPHGEGPIAITDLLGRNADGSRYAFTGWIFGNEARAAYMAMCSLFLDREQVLTCNTYPFDGEWGRYAMNDSNALLSQRGYELQQIVGESTTAAGWLRVLIGGIAADVVMMNTKGQSDIFEMSHGQCSAFDVPLLAQPAVLHLIHSWSMRAPANPDTVGGRWLANGAYAAVGSSHEPYLAAFVPPVALAQRWTNFVPFLVAARWWDGEGPMSKSWRIVTIGDPLMLCAPPADVARTRTFQKADYGVDLAEQVKSLMRRASNDASGEAYAEAMSILYMLGKDDIASELWKLAQREGHSTRAARVALELFFHRRDARQFLEAWHALPQRDRAANDMLWHLLLPRIGSPSANDMLVALQAAIRHPWAHVDIERVAPHLSDTFGRSYVRDLIEREIARSTDTSVRQRLANLLQNFN